MSELNDLMKDCLIAANDNYPDLDYADTVIQAYEDYITIEGEPPVEIVDEVEGEAYFNKCVSFLIDCNLWNMLEKGVLEIESIDEDGDLMYKVIAEF